MYYQITRSMSQTPTHLLWQTLPADLLWKCLLHPLFPPHRADSAGSLGDFPYYHYLTLFNILKKIISLSRLITDNPYSKKKRIMFMLQRYTWTHLSQHIPFLSLKWVFPLSLLALIPSCCQCLFCIRFICIKSFAFLACVQVVDVSLTVVLRNWSIESYAAGLKQVWLTASGPLLPVQPRARYAGTSILPLPT